MIFVSIYIALDRKIKLKSYQKICWTITQTNCMTVHYDGYIYDFNDNKNIQKTVSYEIIQVFI